jgi:hypothetical protein
MKMRQLTRKQISSVRCPTCGVAAGRRCILAAGGLRNEPHGARNFLAAETMGKKRKKESPAARLAQLRKEIAKPTLTKSVREKATMEDLAEWNAHSAARNATELE